MVDGVEYQNVIVVTTVDELLNKYANKNDLELDNETEKTLKVSSLTLNQLLSRVTPSISLKLTADI